MGRSELASLSATIEIMTAKTRAAFLDCREDPTPGPGPRRWWVLLCGGPLDPGDLARRDAARDELRRRAAELGLTVRECVWVWDETDRTQLLAGVFAARTQAEGFARSLEEKGCEVRVTPSFDDPE
ncbi:MAG: hypothetical protein AB1916_08285 [Thermodesulfobacteriota bacterium]